MKTGELVLEVSLRHGERILNHLKKSGGRTDFEIADELGIYLSSVNAARNSLMKAGLVSATGKRRPTGRGGTAMVWEAK